MLIMNVNTAIDAPYASVVTLLKRGIVLSLSSRWKTGAL